MDKILIAIPTYNEIENIRKIIEMILDIDPRFEALVIDDNSPDGTGDLIASYQAKQPRVHLIQREGKLGLGSAYVRAFKYAIEKGYSAVVQMDADFSHNPDYLPSLAGGLDSNDLVIGSRYVPAGGVKNWGCLRRFISRGGSLYARMILGIPIQDLTGGFNAWKISALKRLDLDGIRSEGYSFQIEMKYRASQSGFTITELPIVFEDRTLGKSKMSKRVFLEAIYRVWEMKLYLNRQNPHIT